MSSDDVIVYTSGAAGEDTYTRDAKKEIINEDDPRFERNALTINDSEGSHDLIYPRLGSGLTINNEVV